VTFSNPKKTFHTQDIHGMALQAAQDTNLGGCPREKGKAGAGCTREKAANEKHYFSIMGRVYAGQIPGDTKRLQLAAEGGRRTNLAGNAALL